MTLSRSKIMVGVLILSVGGLAVWADDRNENAHKPNPIMVKTAPVSNIQTGDITTCACPCEKYASRPSPVVSECPDRCPLELTKTAHVAAALEPLDYAPPPAPNTIPSLPSQPPQQFEIPLRIPAPQLEVQQLVLEPLPPMTPPPPPPSQLAPLTPPMVVQAQPLNPPVYTPPQPPIVTPPQPPVVYTPPPPIQQPIPAPDRRGDIPPPPTVSERQPLPSTQQAAQQLRLLLRMGNSETSRFEIRHGEEMLLKVYADKMEMTAPANANGQQPLAGINAIGNVRFYGPGVSGTCDSLSIVSSTGEVLMKGHINMKCKKGRLYNEVSADRMLFQIGGAGLISVTNNNRNTPVTPASYTRD